MIPTQLGYLAAVPFLGGAVLVLWGGGAMQALAMRALVAYAAVVVSFIGAIHWGFGFAQGAPRRSLFVWGVTPAILAWLTLLAPPAIGLGANALLLVACYAVDRAVYPSCGAARWLPLRARLTVIAASSCVIAATAG